MHASLAIIFVLLDADVGKFYGSARAELLEKFALHLQLLLVDLPGDQRAIILLLHLLDRGAGKVILSDHTALNELLEVFLLALALRAPPPLYIL